MPALADAGDAHRGSADLHAAAEGLGHGVGRHDGLGGHGPVVGAGGRKRLREGRGDAVDRQLLHDHAGGERQDLSGRHTDQRGEAGCGVARALQAVGTRARIRVAGVDHQGPDALTAFGHAGQRLAAHLDRSGTETILREHAGDGHPFIQQEHGHVLAIGLAHARLGKTDAHARDGQQGSGIGRMKMNSHGFSLWVCWDRRLHGQARGRARDTVPGEPPPGGPLGMNRPF